MKPILSRKVQFYGVLAFAFVLPVINSLVIFSGAWRPGPATNGRLIFKTAYELCALSALAWILARQGRKFKSIGLFSTPSFKDIGHSILLFLGTNLAILLAWQFLQTSYRIATGHWFSQPWDFRASLFGNTSAALSFLFALINPFYEELLVRAYLITEVEEIYASTKIAAIASVVLQTSYHLYQGLFNAFLLGVCFSLLTWYYVSKRRILPVIFAHMFMDVLAISHYIHSSHSWM